MIVSMPKKDVARGRWLARRQWRTKFVVFAMLNIEGAGRTMVVLEKLETRWSQTHSRRLWRVPAHWQAPR